MRSDRGIQIEILKELRDAGLNEIISDLDGCSPEDFCYNARQLHEGGLIHIQDRGILDNPLACWATRLTPKGHQILEEAENELQRKMKAGLSRAVQVTFDSVLSAILDRIFKL